MSQLAAGEVTASSDFTSMVDPFIGTGNGGHVYPGANIPFGLAKPGPDTDSSNNQAGYYPTGNIKGFSQLHSDGVVDPAFPKVFLSRGSYGNFLLQPVTKSGWSYTDYYSPRVNGSDTASPGYFSIKLDRYGEALIEATATGKTSLYRITYPDDADPAVIMDVGNDLYQSFDQGNVKVSNNSRITGSGKYLASFAPSNAFFTAYFCADFNTKFTRHEIFTSSGIKNASSASVPVSSTPGKQKLGAIAYFDSSSVSSSKPLLARVGVSFISEAQACQNGENEVPDYDFNGVQASAKQLWNDALSRIVVNSGTADQRKLFYSSFYRQMISPVNKTGENAYYKSSDPYYDDFYCGWDIWHGVIPLLSLTQPETTSGVIKTLIDLAANLGWMPDCRMSTQGWTQGGSNADNILSDFLLKLGKDYDGVDWNKGWDALMKDVTKQPPGDMWLREGRGDVAFYNKNGYAPCESNTTWDKPTNSKRSASRTVEYAFNDFVIGLVARALNKTSEYTSFVKRGSNWKTLWNPKVEDSGHKGFIQPKYPNGTWNYYPPQFCGPTMNHTSCFLNDLGGEFYEESPWAYSFFVPQDQQGLINTVGGSKEFVSRLDTYFEKGYHDMGDEPAFLVPFQYIFAGRPDKATTRVHDLLTTQYNTTIEGLPGNDDSGAMGSFVNWVMMGLYPVAGTDLWLLTTPFFDSYTIDLVAINSNFTVKCNNLSDSNKYINSATLNGKPLNRAWLRHAEFAIPNQPAVLELTMGSKWNGWGSTELPPSMTQAKGTAQW
ncbi:hypothetical protein VKS41_002239 [Umbelopsis sp. WA50703]